MWLHDGKRIAYIDDADGFERIAVASVDQSIPPTYVTGDVGRITELTASPCADRLAFANHRHELFVLDLGGEPRLLDTGKAWRIIQLAFSPDGRWLAYVWAPKAETSIIRIADCNDGTVHDATSALRQDRAPAWDPEGKYLYFISARDFNPVYDALQFDLSFPNALRPYVATLRADVANPFVPLPSPLHHDKDDDEEDDDEKDDKDEKKPKAPKPITIDFEGLPQRILAFPVDEGDYERIAGVKGRALFSRFEVHGIKPARREKTSGGCTRLRLQPATRVTRWRPASTTSCCSDAHAGHESHGKLRAIDSRRRSAGGRARTSPRPTREPAPAGDLRTRRVPSSRARVGADAA